MSAKKAASLDASLLVRRGTAAPAGPIDIPEPTESRTCAEQLELEPPSRDGGIRRKVPIQAETRTEIRAPAETETPSEPQTQSKIEEQSQAEPFNAWRAAAALAIVAMSGAAILFWQYTDRANRTVPAADATAPIVESVPHSDVASADAGNGAAQPAPEVTSAPEAPPAPEAMPAPEETEASDTSPAPSVTRASEGSPASDASLTPDTPSAPERVEIAGPENNVAVEKENIKVAAVAVPEPPKPDAKDSGQSAKPIEPSPPAEATNGDSQASSAQAVEPPPIVVVAPEVLAKREPVKNRLVKPHYVIQLSAVKTASGAEYETKRLKRRLGGLLQGKELEVQKAVARGRGTIYRVNLTGFPDRRGAYRLCARIKSHSFDCVVKKR